jgi:hypothetical protein
MPSWILAILVAAAATVSAGVVVSVTIFGQTYTYQSPGGGYHGAPAPVAGAGLPLVVLAGGGYWAYRRFRKKADPGDHPAASFS